MQDDFMDATPYANKLPEYDRSGNWTQDQHLQTYHSQLAIMITACQKNPDLVPVLYGKFAEALKTMKQANGWHAAELFHPIPRHLSSVNDGTDITAVLLGQINRKDPKGSHNVFSGMTQFPLTMIMHGDLHEQEQVAADG